MTMPGRQRGIALLTVMLVFGLAAFIARDMMLTGFTDTQRHVAMRDSRQAFYYALGAESYARELLWRDRDDELAGNDSSDGKLDEWYNRRLAFDLDEGQIFIRVSDLQGRFNLSNLRSENGEINSAAASQLRRLLDHIGIETSLAYRIADWVDKDQLALRNGAEDETWLQGASPMLTGNTAIAQMAELTRLAQLSEQQYKDLNRFLTTLPEPTKLNVNTASEEVILSLAENVNRQATASLVSRQDIKSYQNVSQALSDAGLSSAGLSTFFTTRSEYYEIEIIALYRERTARLHSVVHREPTTGKTQLVYRLQSNGLEAG